LENRKREEASRLEAERLDREIEQKRMAEEAAYRKEIDGG